MREHGFKGSTPPRKRVPLFPAAPSNFGQQGWNQRRKDDDVSHFDMNRHGIAGYVSYKVNGGSLADEISQVRENVSMAQSPIEADFLAWLSVQKQFRICSYPESRRLEDCGGFNGLIIPQCPHGPYVVDFLVVVGLKNGGIRMLAIECDGHEYHAKTKYQVARDKRRDRYFAANSIGVMRFTGSEIYNDAQSCAVEILKAITKIHAESEMYG